MVFLDRVEGGRWQVVSLSYGTKSFGTSDALDAATLAAYRSRVKEMVAILEMPDADARRMATTEWLVACAEDPATRWEGAYDLRPLEWKAGGLRDRLDPAEEDFDGALLPEHRERLVAAILAETDLDSRGTATLLELLVATRDPRLLAAIERQLDEAIASPTLTWAHTVFPSGVISAMRSWERGKALEKELDEALPFFAGKDGVVKDVERGRAALRAIREGIGAAWRAGAKSAAPGRGS